LTAYFSGSLLQRFDAHTIFAITASFPLIVSAVAGLIAESRVSAKPNWSVVSHQLGQLRQAVTQKVIWLPTAFLFLWQATPTADSAFFYFTTNELGFQPEFLGRVRLVTSLASLVGVWLFQRFFKEIPFRAFFGWTTLLSAVLGMTMLLLVTHTNRALGIDDHWFSLGDSLILTVMGQIAYMPVLVLAARLCPAGVEATLFALLMSITNLAGLVSYELGAVLMHWLGITETNFSSLWLLVLITNFSTLLPLPFLGWLPGADPKTESGTATLQAIPAIERDLATTKQLG
jgi:folate/biopterin transporter